MKYLGTLGLLLSCVVVLSQAVPHCHMSELWNCAEIAIDWLHTLPKRQIPVKEEDIQVFCNAITKAVDCGFSYIDKCTTFMQRELIDVLVEGAVSLKTDFCTPGSKSRTTYLDHSVCLNKVSQMDEIKEQMEYSMALFEKFESLESNQWLNFVCCGYAKVVNAVIKLGNETCGEEAVDAVQEILSMAYAQLPEIICGGYDGDEEHCTTILPPAGSKPSDGVKGQAIYKFFQDVLKNWLD